MNCAGEIWKPLGILQLYLYLIICLLTVLDQKFVHEMFYPVLIHFILLGDLFYEYQSVMGKFDCMCLYLLCFSVPEITCIDQLSQHFFTKLCRQCSSTLLWPSQVVRHLLRQYHF